MCVREREWEAYIDRESVCERECVCVCVTDRESVFVGGIY